MEKNTTAEQAREFLTNEKNVMNCKECPMNEEFAPGPNHNVLKCGQYHCWVSLHVDGEEED